MKIVCSPSEAYLAKQKNADVRVLLFGIPKSDKYASCGNLLESYFAGREAYLETGAWDLLAFSLAVIAADLSVPRKRSPDGWTRVIDLEISVIQPNKWIPLIPKIQHLLRFLSTDIWRLTFVKSGYRPQIGKSKKIKADCVSLLSGGLDSLIGGLDLVSKKRNPVFVSQTVRGDKQNQINFAKAINPKTSLIQVSHRFHAPAKRVYFELSQRARSIIFLAFGTVTCTLLENGKKSPKTDLIVSENGLISLNPPLTPARIGSLSTRTTHPHFIKCYQDLIDSLGFKVNIVTPYSLLTKGEMLAHCKRVKQLQKLAYDSTSCGKVGRRQKQCGKCMPCLIRRAAFAAAGVLDKTDYENKDLRKVSDYDDVRSAAIAINTIKTSGFDRWFANAQNNLDSINIQDYKAVAQRGIEELESLLQKYKIC
ncbi:MAG: 7-cyano-7-deazaguanine synthase [Turneriella sp.]|nr:7-cyano-7-deazaguanine synthase [Turneriella sp.]